MSQLKQQNLGAVSSEHKIYTWSQGLWRIQIVILSQVSFGFGVDYIIVVTI